MKISYNCEIVQSRDTPELSIADYLLWSIQRYLLKGDHRFYKALEDKYHLVLDPYALETPTAYDQKNKLDIDKMEELKTDGYIK